MSTLAERLATALRALRQHTTQSQLYIANALADEALADYATACAAGPLRIMVTLEGGMVQWVGSNDPELPVEVLIVDYDTDEADEDEVLFEIPQSSPGSTEEAYARHEDVDRTDPTFVNNAYKAVEDASA